MLEFKVQTAHPINELIFFYNFAKFIELPGKQDRFKLPDCRYCLTLHL